VLTLTNPSAFPITVTLTTSDGTASFLSDYAALTQALVFAPLSTTVTTQVVITADNVYENDETVTLTLSGEQNATLTPLNPVTLTIVNDDALPQIAFSGAPYSLNEDSGPATIVLTLTNPSAFPITVTLTTSDGTASFLSDYAALTQALLFAPLQTAVTTTITISDDVIYEGNETVTLTLSSPVNATIIGTNPAVLTIVDNETQPTVQFSASAYSVTEDAGPAVITVTLSGQSAFTVTVTVTSTNGTAIAPADYASVSAVLTFAPGVTQQTFNVSIAPDLLDELDETLLLTLGGAINTTITGTNPVTLTILDDDLPPSLSISGVTQNEGDTGATSFVFTVTLSAPSGLTVTVNYTTGDDTALTADGDYNATSSTVTFAPGATTRFITVTVNGDMKFELDETFVVTLTNPVNATLAITSAIGAIVNDDALPSVQFNSTQYSVVEDLGPATITVTLSNPSAFTITVNYTSANGTALGGADYVAANGVMTFAPNTTQQTFAVATIVDNIDEANETVLLGLSSPVSATLGVTNTATLIITDDDPTPSVSFSAPTYFTNELTTTVSILVELSNPSAFTITVNYATSDNSATAGLDYISASGALTFTPGMTQQGFSVSILHDVISESDETVTLTLSSPISATLGVINAATLVIVDNDGTPRVNFESVVYAAAENVGAAVITVTLTNPSAFTITVGYSTTNGTASASADYTATTGVLTFTPGTTALTFSVPIMDDAIDEPNETITLTLSNPVSATLGIAPTATLTIVDDEPTPSITLSASGYSVNETAGAVVVTATLSGQSAFTITVVITTSDGAATAGNDYAALSATLTFAPLQTSVTTSIAISDDVVYESSETFNIGLSGESNATLGAPSTAVVTILDDELQPTVQLDSATYTVGETAGAVVVTATLSGQSAFTVTVTLTTTNNIASDASDYAPQNVTLTFAPLQTSVTASIAITDDAVFEDSETFNVGLSNAVSATVAAPSAAVVTILDNELQPTVQLSNATYSVNENAGFVAVTATLSGPSAFTTTVIITTSNSTATAMSDYDAITTTLTFAPLQTSVTQPITINDDVAYEGDETFHVGLSNAVSATLNAPSAAVVTIVEDEAVPTAQFSASAYSVSENVGAATMTVTLNYPSVFTITVNYATSNGTAVAGSDYNAASGTLTFTPGITRQTFAVAILNDTLDEANETVNLTLSGAVSATIGATNLATLTIVDDDPTPSLVIADVTKSEGNVGAAHFVFTVTLSAPSGLTVTVNYSTANGTANAPSDYITQNGVLTFTAGITTQLITVTVNGDTTYEVNETFFVNLSGANNATLADAQGVGTILNDDANLAPTANAGPDQIVFVSTLVTLDGSTSSDADGHLPLAYRWTQLSGTPVVLNSNVISRPTFTSPATPAILTFRLIVTDTVGAPSTADTVVVTVTDRLLAGLSLTASLPVTATKPATFTTNITSGTNVTYTWQFGDGTPVVVNGSVITHTYATPGIYTVIVTATNSVSIITKTLVVTVNPAIIVLPPTVFKTYLPIVMKSSAPDLVGSFSLSPNKNNFAAGEPVTIFVTVTNQGNAAAGPFWVDFYINPSPMPTTNVIWNYACNMNPCLGLAWYVEGLAPGQSIVLTSLPGSYGAAYSRWYGWFASGTSDLYVYVDVWNPPVPTGGVLESNETNNRSERHGLVVTGTNPALPSPLGLEEIPTRPQPR
jgi:hypothetical protein